MRNRPTRTIHCVVNAEHGLGTGLGDVIQMCWFPDEISFYAESPVKRSILTMFGRTIVDDKTDAKMMKRSFQYDLSGLKRRPRLTSWLRGLRIKGVPRRPKYVIQEDAMVWADLVTRTNKPTMLFPTSKVANRTWPATYWVELAWLLKERGEHPMIFVLEKDEKWNTAPNYAFGFDINHLAALMLRCKRVICNDSMAAHLAGNMNAKATVLAGPTNHNIFSHCPSVRVMHSKRYDCSPCCYKEPFRGSCDLGCHALYGLFPADVLAAL